MGKAAKKLRSDKKKAAKQAQKRANRAKYDSWRDAGMNQKSKRQVKKSKNQTMNKTNKNKHLTHDCGNPGCTKCNPRDIKSFLVLGRNESIRWIRKTYGENGKRKQPASQVITTAPETKQVLEVA